MGLTKPCPWGRVNTNWYETHADVYARTADVLDVSKWQARFCAALSQTGPVLDVGCGTGRDLDALRKIGVQGIGWEPSVALAHKARSKNLIVAHNTYEDIPRSGPWAGIWSMASLLHTPLDAWPRHIEAMLTALSTKGAFYLAIKEGPTEWTDAAGRRFAGCDEDTLLSFFPDRAYSSFLIEREHLPGRTGEPTTWLNVLLTI